VTLSGHHFALFYIKQAFRANTIKITEARHYTRRSVTGRSASPHPTSRTTCYTLSPHHPASPSVDVDWRHICVRTVTV